ncbi:MAG: hypothetical protein IJ939_05345, partial [Clostridia bacterium]|nr:hypothetical protein [Clostridia bacterium]
NASTTVAEVISKLGLNDANGVVSALRTADGTEYTSGLISDIFGGTDCGYLEFVYETTQAITVEKNVAYTDVTDALVTATGSGSYSPRQTVADILANITVSPEYAGVYVVAGLATSAKGAPLAATTKVSELASNTLYIVWGELNIIAGTEFSSAEDVMGDTECTEVVENGVLKLTRTANGEIYLGFSDVLNVAEVDDIQIRLRYVGNGKTDTTTSDYWFVEWDGNFVNNGITYPVNDGQWVTLSFKKNIGGSIADVKNASSKITSFRTPHFDEDVMPVGTSIEIDFVRVIGTEPLNYVTVDVSALTGIENDTLRYGFNKTKTFDQIRERLEKDLEDVLDENTAITGLIYNDTTYTGSTTLYSVVGQTDCEMTVDYGKAKTVTLVQESLTSPDGETVVSNIAASAYPASTTLGELKALLSLDSADFFVEGFTNAIYGAAYPNDTQLSYFGKDVTNVELYVAYDKQVILDGSEFTEKPVGNQTAFASDEIIDDPAATDGKAYKITMNSGSLYSEFQRRSIDVSEVSDIVARVKATVVKKAYFPFVYSVSGTQSTPGSEQYTFSTDYDVVRLSTYATLPAECILTSFRPPMAHSNVDSFPVGGSIIYDYIRVLGKPLPEVNVADIDSQYGDIELSGYDLMNVDYLKSMTFADLVEKIGYTPVDAYRIVAFVGEREYGLHENMTEALGGTGTVNLTPVVEKVFGKTYRVDFGTQADFFAEIGTAVELDVTEYGKTLADLAAKMVDHGNKIFKGFATSADATEVLALDTPIAPSSEEEYVANNNTAPVAIYYAIWEDYIVNDLYSVEFVENKGYKVSTPGKASKYAMDALEENGTDYVWGDENNELPEVFEYQFVEHKTDESNGYIRLKFDASPYAVAQIGKPITNKAGQVITPTHAGTWDSSIVLGGLSGSPYIPAGLIDKVIIRMRYGGVLPTEKTYFATPGSGEGYSTVSPTDFYAPFFYYTNEDYINFTDSQRYINYIDVSKDIYNGKWFTVVVDAADLKLDSKDLYDLRIDPTNGMLDGSYLDIDFIRFTQKTAGVVNEEAVKSQKDFEEGSELYNTLATNVRAAVNNDGLNGVRVMGWLYVYADASAHTKNAGWMFSASDRFKRAVADSEDGWMNKLTMDLYNDAKFNTSSLILVGNYIEDGEKVTTPQGYDSENPLFSAVLYNIPVKNYESNFVVRPYVEYAGRFIYGEPFEMNFYDFAFGTDYTGDIAGAGGAYGACENKDCAICNYLEECYVNWNAHVAEKATFTEHYNNNFASIMVPSTITSYIVIPTGTISNETDTQVDLEVWQNGSIATVTVNKANTWPALVVDGKLNSLYTLRPCAYNNGYILSLGYGRDSDNGNHVGIEKTDTSVLNGEAVADANEMFIRNRFVPEAQSPFRQINRLAQLPMTGANASNSTFVNSFFLGDHGFGYYWFSTTIWSGTTREYWAGKTAYPLENAKVVVKYNYSDGTSEWVTYDKTALYNLTTIDFSNISYIVSNDIDNKPVDNETVSGSANGISYS